MCFCLEVKKNNNTLFWAVGLFFFVLHRLWKTAKYLLSSGFQIPSQFFFFLFPHIALFFCCHDSFRRVMFSSLIAAHHVQSLKMDSFYWGEAIAAVQCRPCPSTPMLLKNQHALTAKQWLNRGSLEGLIEARKNPTAASYEINHKYTSISYL